MNTAKENIEQLPETCFGVMLIDKSLIMIKSGSLGYHKVSQTVPKKWCRESGITMNEVADQLNEKDGTTKAQRRAMENGSQFGFDVGLADASKFDENGFFIKDK